MVANPASDASPVAGRPFFAVAGLALALELVTGVCCSAGFCSAGFSSGLVSPGFSSGLVSSGGAMTAFLATASL